MEERRSLASYYTSTAVCVCLSVCLSVSVLFVYLCYTVATVFDEIKLTYYYSNWKKQKMSECDSVVILSTVLFSIPSVILSIK